METLDKQNNNFNYPSFPPDAELRIDTEIGIKLMEASRRLAQLKGMASVLPNQHAIFNLIALLEARASAAIADVHVTDHELYLALSSSGAGSLKGPAKGIILYRNALWKGYQLHLQGNNSSIDTIVEVYRDVQQRHLAPHPVHPESIGKLIAALSKFLNDDYGFPRDPLLKLTMACYQLEITPPQDYHGGQAGRFLCILYLVQKGLLEYPIFYLSNYTLNNKAAYEKALASVAATGKWKQWVMFSMEAISQTAQNTIEIINRIRAYMERAEATIRENNLQISRLSLSKLFEQPYIRPKNLVCPTIKSVNTAKKYLCQLESLGLLKKEKMGKEYVWINTDLMTIMSD